MSVPSLRRSAGHAKPSERLNPRVRCPAATCSQPPPQPPFFYHSFSSDQYCSVSGLNGPVSAVFRRGGVLFFLFVCFFKKRVYRLKAERTRLIKERTKKKKKKEGGFFLPWHDTRPKEFHMRGALSPSSPCVATCRPPVFIQDSSVQQLLEKDKLGLSAWKKKKKECKIRGKILKSEVDFIFIKPGFKCQLLFFFF